MVALGTYLLFPRCQMLFGSKVVRLAVVALRMGKDKIVPEIGGIPRPGNISEMGKK